VNIGISNLGIDCDLYIANNLDIVESEDVYAAPGDYSFDHYTCQVSIDWSPNVWRLKGWGLYVEGELPLLAWLPTEALGDGGSNVNIDVTRHSYFTIDPQFIPDNWQGVEEFEITDIGIKGFHDAVIRKVYKCAPRRVIRGQSG
jgi:hypothetical protein